MLIDYPVFDHTASVPWPDLGQTQIDWELGVRTIETWLDSNVGSHYVKWGWADSGSSRHIGVSFRWDQDRTLFILAWS